MAIPSKLERPSRSELSKTYTSDKFCTRLWAQAVLLSLGLLACTRSMAQQPTDTVTSRETSVPQTPPDLTLDVPSPDAADAQALALPTPPARYSARRLAGFAVFVHDDVLAHPTEATAVIARIDSSLADLRTRFGTRTAAIERVILWVEWTPFQPERRRGVAEYHPSREWLIQNGYDPAKAQGVEINDTRGFLAAADSIQPFVLVHEFAHAYENLALTGESGIEAVYQAAVAGGQYDSVLHANGSRMRHYALTNGREYFAETTEAFLAVNDFYPFIREQLRDHDPMGYALMERVWGSQPARPVLPALPCDPMPFTESNGVRSFVVVENNTPSPIQLFWVDGSRTRHPNAQVAPGAVDIRQTFAGHAWIALTANGQCVSAFVAGASTSRALILNAR